MCPYCLRTETSNQISLLQMNNLSSKAADTFSSDRKQRTIGLASYEHLSSVHPIVSVCVVTYNHREFISQALDSVLMQEIDLPVEIIVHDDCSTDGTTDIVRSYAEQHSRVIRPIFQKENQYSKGEKIFPKTFQLARGKYIALLEGDDAWTDPHKLRRQVEFLEKNTGCIMCYGNVTLVDAEGNVLKENRIPASECRLLRQEEIIIGALTPTATVMFRNHPILRRLPRDFKKIANGDRALFALLGQHGTAGYLDFKPSLYRQHGKGVYSSLDEDQKRVGHLNTYKKIHKFIQKKYRILVVDMIARIYMSRAVYLRSHGKGKELLRNILGFIWFSGRHRKILDFFRDLKNCLYQCQKWIIQGSN